MRVAVVGASLAGLSAGALLARRGCQVTVFEKSDRPGGLDEEMTRKGAVHLPGDHLLWGWRSSRALARLFGSLRDRPGATARRLLKPVPIGFQVLGHPHRLDWGERLLEEVGREFPEGQEAWKACMTAWEGEVEALQRAGAGLPFVRSSQPLLAGPAEVAHDAWDSDEPPQGPQDRRALRRALAERSFLNGPAGELTDDLQNCLKNVALAVSWRPAEEVYMPTWLWAMHMFSQEAAVLRDGLEGLLSWLAGRLEAAGGSLRLGTRVRSVKLRGRRVKGVAFQEGKRRSSLPAEAVVVAGGEVSRLVPFRRLRARQRRSVGTLATCLLAVEDEAVAEPMAPLVAYSSAPEQPILLLSHNPMRRYIGGERPQRLLTVAWRADGPSGYEMELPEELPKRLQQLMPFLPGRWELIAQDADTGNPVKRHPIAEVDLKDFDPTTQVGGLVVAEGNLLPGVATTASLTLGVAAAEAVLRGR
jgi:phytoene dehydrogenase-like protein